MKTKMKIKNIWGSVIFEYEKENNTFSETVKEYIRKTPLTSLIISAKN